MKTLFQQLLVRLTKNELKDLTKEVKETIFLDHDVAVNKKSLTSADLWRIHTSKKTVAIRRPLNL